MRVIKTYILHLYFDADTPERFCGNLRYLEDPDTHPFRNQVEFEEVLHRLIRKPSGTQTTQPGVNVKTKK
jgi:hypothetical protein